ncbi:hypothetical protein A2U01_0067527, partial [Trifolium medium]|nr:hypothetical protein [Trifolium medium]
TSSKPPRGHLPPPAFFFLALNKNTAAIDELMKLTAKNTNFLKS